MKYVMRATSQLIKTLDVFKGNPKLREEMLMNGIRARDELLELLRAKLDRAEELIESKEDEIHHLTDCLNS